MKKLLLLLVPLLLSTACAYTPHEIDVELTQSATNFSNLGQGTTIRLRVIDERDELDIGRRGAGISVAKVEAPDLIPKLTRAIEEGFIAKGYTLTDRSTDAEADLVVSLRTLKFLESSGFWTIGAEVDAALLAEAERGSEDYRNQYRSSDEDRQFAVSTGAGIDEQINMVLNEVLSQLFADRQLDDFLTGN